MAMAAIGTVLIVVGALALAGGLGYVGYAYMKQDKNNDGLYTDPGQGKENKDRAYLGFYIAGGGLLVALLGVALNVGGRRRSAGGTA
jgi:hypothetical protein